MPLLDTRRSHDLTGALIADIVLQLLAYVAELERRQLRERQAQGIAAAIKRGVRFGPLPKAPPPEYPGVFSMWQRGELSAQQASMRCGVSRNTFMRWARDDN